jgi:hypothetical protein
MPATLSQSWETVRSLAFRPREELTPLPERHCDFIVDRALRS